MKLIIKNSSSEPIYEQIVKQIISQIISKDLKSGDILPSIRSLARELNVSVITTKRAYEILSEKKFIDTVSGKGSFIAEIDEKGIKEYKLKIIREKIIELIKEAKSLNINDKELYQEIINLYKED